MQLKNKMILAIALPMLLVGLGYGQDKAAVIAKLTEIGKKSNAEMMTGKINMEYYADDAISMPNNQPLVKGKPAIKQNFEAAIQAGFKFDSFTSTPTDVIVDGKTIVEMGTYAMKASFPGAPPIEDKGKYLTVWEVQKDGSYKIKVETWNTDVSPQM